MAKQDWSPRGQEWPRIRVIANLGDVNPYTYGGYIVFEAVQKNGDRSIDAEYWDEPLTDIATVYRFQIEPDVLRDLDWVKWGEVIDAVMGGTSRAELLRLGRSPDPLERAELYRAAGSYYGWANLDSDPLRLSKAELEARWPDFGARRGRRGRRS